MTYEIQIGDYVTNTATGITGILDNVFSDNGVTKYAVVSETDAEEFEIATEIVLFKRA